MLVRIVIRGFSVDPMPTSLLASDRPDCEIPEWWRERTDVKLFMREMDWRRVRITFSGSLSPTRPMPPVPPLPPPLPEIPAG
jgi:hypothetical protein